VHGDGLANRGGFERDRYLSHKTKSYLDSRAGLGETVCGNNDVIGGDREIVNPEFTAVVARSFPLEGEIDGIDHDFCIRNTRAAGIQHGAA
jgi:hypothetical protein